MSEPTNAADKPKPTAEHIDAVARAHQLIGVSMWETSCACGEWPSEDGPQHHLGHVLHAFLTSADPAAQAANLPTDVIVAEARRRGCRVISTPPATWKPPA